MHIFSAAALIQCCALLQCFCGPAWAHGPADAHGVGGRRDRAAAHDDAHFWWGLFAYTLLYRFAEPILVPGCAPAAKLPSLRNPDANGCR